MLKWAKRAALVLLGVVVLGALLFFALPWLVIGPADKPREADVILHFALAEELHGDEYAVELLRQGQAKHIVCLSAQASWQVYAADYARAHLIELGAPADQVSVLHTPRLECRKQVLPFIAEYVKQQGWRRVLMVVEPTVSRADRRVNAASSARVISRSSRSTGSVGSGSSAAAAARSAPT